MSAACQPPHTTLGCQAWVSRLLPFHHYLLLTARAAAQHEAHINNMTSEADIPPPLTLLLHTVAAHSWNSNLVLIKGLFLQMKVVSKTQMLNI